MAKKHKFHSTHIEHHSDGSHTVHHRHEDPAKDVKYAAGDHDGMMDGMMEHTSEPNPGEAQADAGQHGVPAAIAGPAGLPMQGA